MKNVALITLGGLGLALVAVVLVMPRDARADVLPPNMTCGNKQTGDACTDDGRQAGVCTRSTCSRLSYAPGPDGTPTHQSVQYDCVLCVASTGAAPSPSPSPSAGPSPSPTTAPTADKGPRGCGAAGAPVDGVLLVASALGALGALATRRRKRA